MKDIIIGAVIGMAVLGFVLWSNDHDKKVAEGAEKYEQCVKSQYGVTPAFWYAEHGEYPNCK